MTDITALAAKAWEDARNARYGGGEPRAAIAAVIAPELEQRDREIERLREALVMAVATMMRASGRIEIIASCNEDRRLSASLSGASDFARTALGASHD